MYDGRPEAAGDAASVADRIEAHRATVRKRLIVPATPGDMAGLALAYASPDLGKLIIEKSGAAVRVRAAAWNSEVASRHNDDGTESLITVDPAIMALNWSWAPRVGCAPSQRVTANMCTNSSQPRIERSGRDGDK